MSGLDIRRNSVYCFLKITAMNAMLCKYCNDNVLVQERIHPLLVSVSFRFYRKHCNVSRFAIV